MAADYNVELLSRYLDGELDAPDRAMVEGWLNEDPELEAVLVDMREIGQAVRRDTQEAMAAVDFDAARSRLMANLPEQEPVVAQHAASRPGLLDSLRLWLKPVWGISAGLAVVVIVTLAIVSEQNVNDNGATLNSDTHQASNECVVDRLQAVNSASVVFKAEDNDPKDADDPVTVIWVFEQATENDPS